VVAIALASFLLLSHTARAQSNGQSEIEIGFAICGPPVPPEVSFCGPLDLHGKNRALVGLGSYIVNAQSGCNDCHIGARNDNRNLYLAGGRFFGPVGPAPNLTPDESGLPNGLTLQQFFDIMRNGVDPEGNPIRPPMPWPVYRNMTDRDLTAIYEFLSSLPTEPGPR
jgi:hypothetical protein